MAMALQSGDHGPQIAHDPDRERRSNSAKGWSAWKMLKECSPLTDFLESADRTRQASRLIRPAGWAGSLLWSTGKTSVIAQWPSQTWFKKSSSRLQKGSMFAITF